jgi:large subunit ribosomal protein L11
MQVKLLAEGGNMKPGPALSQKLGPMGININKVIQKINEETENFKGLKIPVELDVDPATKEFRIQIFSPPIAELLKKEAGIEKGSGIQKRLQVANLSIEQIISVAKTKLPNLLCKDLNSAVKTVVGSCVSLGILIENKPAVEIEKEISQGKYHKEISQGKTETSEEKKSQLREYFSEIRSKQEQIIEQEKKAKEAEAEAKVETAAEAPKEEKKEEKKVEKKIEKK